MELDPCDHNHMSIQLHTLIIQYSLKSFGKQMNRGKKKYKICKVVFSKCWEDAWSKDSLVKEWI